MQQANLVWGWKAIGEEVSRLLGYCPSIATLYRWAKKDKNRLPVREMDGTGRACANVQELESWREKVIK